MVCRRKWEASVGWSGLFDWEDGCYGLGSKGLVMKSGPLGFEEVLEMSLDLLKIEGS